MQLKRNGNGHNGNGRNGNGQNGVVKIILLAFVVLLVAVLAWRLFDRWRGPTAEVWVAAADLAPGSLVAADDLERTRRRASDLPAGALDRQEAIAGRRLARAKQQGDPFVSGDFAAGGGGERQPEPGLSELLPAGRVLMEVRVPLENVVMRELRRGDRLDFLAAPPRAGGRPRLVASDVYLVAYVDPNLLRQQQQGQQRANGNGTNGDRPSLIESLLQTTSRAAGSRGPVMTSSTNMLLAVRPEDVVPLAEAQSSRAALTFVLHGQKEVKEGQLLTVQGQSWGVEYITGAARGSVEFIR